MSWALKDVSSWWGDAVRKSGVWKTARPVSRGDEPDVIRESESPVILVIEDDQSISEIVTRVLRQEGCVTHAAFDGAQGLDTFYLSPYRTSSYST